MVCVDEIGFILRRSENRCLEGSDENLGEDLVSGIDDVSRYFSYHRRKRI